MRGLCRRLTAAAVLASIACGASGGAVPAPDAGTSALEVEVGTGQFEFEPLVDDAPVDVVCGPQGGQHIWVSVRARNLDPAHASVSVRISLDASGQIVCGQQIDDVSLLPAAGWYEFTGIACFVTDPGLIEGRPVTLLGKVTEGRVRAAEARVRAVPRGPGRSCVLGGGDGGR
jgi:hypothetical protein